MVAGAIEGFEEQLPTYRARFSELTESVKAWASDLGVPISESNAEAGMVLDLLGATASGVGSMVGGTIFVLLVVAFLLIDARRLWRRVYVHFGNGGEKHALSDMSAELYRYLGVKTATSVATGLLVGGWCAIVGVDFAVLWGFTAFVLNYVPTIGSALATMAPTLVALVMQGMGPAVLVLSGCLTVNLVIGSVLEPRLLGRAVGLSPTAVLIALVFWGWVLGPVGAILSVPLAMVVKAGLASTREYAWMADLMSAKSPGPDSVPPEPGADPEPDRGDPPEPTHGIPAELLHRTNA